MHARTLFHGCCWLVAFLGATVASARTDVTISVSGTSSSPGEIALVGGLPPSGAPYWVVRDGSGAELASGTGSATVSLPTGSYSVDFVSTFTEDGNSYPDISGQFDWASGTWAWLNGSSSSADFPDGPVETWIPFDEPQGWVAGPWTPDASGVWEDQTVTQNRTDSRLHNTGERSSLDSTLTRNLGSYTEYFTFPPQTVPGTRPLNPRVVSDSTNWGPWSGSAPGETADNPPWSWSGWSPSPGWYWEDQTPTSTTQTRTGTRTVTYTTAAYTQTRTGTQTENWTNDRGNTWSIVTSLVDDQTIPASARTEPQSTSDSQTVADSPKPLNPTHILDTGPWEILSAWSPDTSTVPSGQTFTQTQTFRRWLTDYWINDRGDRWNDVSAWENSSESQSATGTGAVPNSAPTGSLTGPTTLSALQSGTWNFSAADVDGNLAQWRFYNSTNPGAAYSPITTGSSVSGSHTQSFATSGPQEWRLDIVDADGASVTKTLAVTVNPAAQAVVALTPATASVTAGGSATFTASGGSGTGAYTWGGAASGTGASKTITFPATGTFAVTVFRAGDATYAASATTSATVTVTVGADTLAPSAPTGLATTFVAASSFTVSWTASTDNVGIAGYDVRLDGGVPLPAAGAGGFSHTFTGLAFNSTHVAEVRARDAAGNLSAWTAHPAATNSGSTGLNTGQSAWFDVDGDGIRDEIVPANSADFTYDIVQWFSVESLPPTFQPNDFWFNFDAVFTDADGGRLFEGFSQIFVPTPVT